MKLWTVQNLIWWKHSQQLGILRGNPKPPDIDRSFLEAYDWMRDQMAIRVAGFSGSYPVWAWNFSHPFDLNHPWGQPGTEMILLTMDVPKERCLESDFIAWHQVLNRSPISWLDDCTEEEMQYSWNKIFDTNLHPDWSSGLKQYCIDEVPISFVTGTCTFTIPHSKLIND